MFYGTHKILEIQDITEGDLPYKLIFFHPEVDDRGEERSIPPEQTSQEMLARVQTETESSAEEMYKTRIDFIVTEIIQLMRKHNIYEIELGAVTNWINMRYKESMDQMDEVARGEKDYRKSLVLANRIIRNYNDQKGA